jgi:hypothetical protein
LTNQQVRKAASRSAASALEHVIRATKDLAHYAEMQQLTEADEMLTELLAAIYASRHVALPETSTATEAPRADKILDRLPFGGP